MNEEDLRDCFAMFALIAATKDGSYIAGVKAMAITAYELADEMMEARKKKEEVTAGLPAIKRKNGKTPK